MKGIYPVLFTFLMLIFILILNNYENSKTKREEKIISYISNLTKAINKLKNTKAPEDLIRNFQDNLNYYIEGLTDVLGKKKVNKILDKVALKIEWEYVHLLERYPEVYEQSKGVNK